MARHTNKKASKLTERRAQAAVALLDTLPLLPPDCWAMTAVLYYEDDTSLTFDIEPEDEPLPELPGLRERKRRRKT